MWMCRAILKKRGVFIGFIKNPHDAMITKRPPLVKKGVGNIWCVYTHAWIKYRANRISPRNDVGII
jgi:hypothetical protein